MPETKPAACPIVVVVLACIAGGYFVANVFYLIGVRVLGLGTPFLDSLTPEQQRIMAASARKRRALFYVSFGIGLVVIGVTMACIARSASR